MRTGLHALAFKSVQVTGLHTVLKLSLVHNVLVLVKLVEE